MAQQLLCSLRKRDAREVEAFDVVIRAYSSVLAASKMSLKFKEANPDLDRRIDESSRVRTKHKGKVRENSCHLSPFLASASV